MRAVGAVRAVGSVGGEGGGRNIGALEGGVVRAVWRGCFSWQERWRGGGRASGGGGGVGGVGVRGGWACTKTRKTLLFMAGVLEGGGKCERWGR